MNGEQGLWGPYEAPSGAAPPGAVWVPFNRPAGYGVQGGGLEFGGKGIRRPQDESFMYPYVKRPRRYAPEGYGVPATPVRIRRPQDESFMYPSYEKRPRVGVSPLEALGLPFLPAEAGPSRQRRRIPEGEPFSFVQEQVEPFMEVQNAPLLLDPFMETFNMPLSSTPREALEIPIPGGRGVRWEDDGNGGILTRTREIPGRVFVAPVPPQQRPEPSPIEWSRDEPLSEIERVRMVAQQLSRQVDELPPIPFTKQNVPMKWSASKPRVAGMTGAMTPKQQFVSKQVEPFSGMTVEEAFADAERTFDAELSNIKNIKNSLLGSVETVDEEMNDGFQELKRAMETFADEVEDTQKILNKKRREIGLGPGNIGDAMGRSDIDELGAAAAAAAGLKELQAELNAVHTSEEAAAATDQDAILDEGERAELDKLNHPLGNEWVQNLPDIPIDKTPAEMCRNDCKERVRIQQLECDEIRRRVAKKLKEVGCPSIATAEKVPDVCP